MVNQHEKAPFLTTTVYADQDKPGCPFVAWNQRSKGRKKEIEKWLQVQRI